MLSDCNRSWYQALAGVCVVSKHRIPIGKGNNSYREGVTVCHRFQASFFYLFLPSLPQNEVVVKTGNGSPLKPEPVRCFPFSVLVKTRLAAALPVNTDLPGSLAAVLTAALADSATVSLKHLFHHPTYLSFDTGVPLSCLLFGGCRGAGEGGQLLLQVKINVNHLCNAGFQPLFRCKLDVVVVRYEECFDISFWFL